MARRFNEIQLWHSSKLSINPNRTCNVSKIMKEPFYVSNRIVHKALSTPTVNNVAKTFDIGVQFWLLELLCLMTI
ncbi:hypothetical protein FWK35_00030816, partial [Aphis craccivora]